MDRGRVILVQSNSAHIPLPSQSVHCVVTSPPYWRQRAYEGEQKLSWPATEFIPLNGTAPIEVPAWHGELGLEPIVDWYIGHLMLIFREVHRVLRDDGVFWLNIDDKQGREARTDPYWRDGDLRLIPQRIALALQADNWIVRQDCIWHKATPMPESMSGWAWSKTKCCCNQGKGGSNRYIVSAFDYLGRVQSTIEPIEPDPDCQICGGSGYLQDSPLDLRLGSWRPTRSHEYVFMLTKGLGYFADSAKTRIRAKEKDWAWRNIRSVLRPRSEFYKQGAHFAVYPTTLIAPLIRATCPAKACVVCGRGWAPEITGQAVQYRPSCECGSKDWHLGKVLDPFAGSGTVGVVARELGLDCILLDLSRAYLSKAAGVRVSNRTPRDGDALKELPLFANLRREGVDNDYER